MNAIERPGVDAIGGNDLDRFRLRRFLGDLAGTGEIETREAAVDLADIAAILDGNPKAVHFRAVGPERLLFGSGAPARPIQAPLNAVLAADMSEPDRRAILADNAARVFGLPTPQFEMPQLTRSTGLIDIHGHVGALGLPTPLLQLHEQLAASSRHGISQTVASSLRALADDVLIGNTEAFDAARNSGGRLRAYVVVNPNDLDGASGAMDSAYARDDAVGAKLHCQWSGQVTASPACVCLMHAVARRGRPLKIHVDGAGWDDALACVAGEHPEWKLIVAHGGPGTPSVAGADLVARTNNVYLELSTSFADLPVARQVVQRVGPRRLLFGSDAPLLDPAYVLGLYADAGADLACTPAVAREVFDL